MKAEGEKIDPQGDESPKNVEIKEKAVTEDAIYDAMDLKTNKIAQIDVG